MKTVKYNWFQRISLILFLFLVFSGRLYGFNFVVMGDSLDGEGTAPVFNNVIEEISLLQPDFIVDTGDWTSGPDKAGWENFLKMMQLGKTPFYLAVGNHEITGDWGIWYTWYKELLNKPLYYSFNYENCAFIILCCYCEENGKTVAGKIDKNQFTWLEQELKKAESADHIFVFIHEPLYPVGIHIGSSLDRFPEERDKLASLLKKYKDKLIVFCGHEHLYNKSVVDGLTQIIAGGTGAPLYAKPENGGFYHYLYLTVHGKNLSIAVIKPGHIVSSDLPKK